jgi:hypothetical protein
MSTIPDIENAENELCRSKWHVSLLILSIHHEWNRSHARSHIRMNSSFFAR